MSLIYIIKHWNDTLVKLTLSIICVRSLLILQFLLLQMTNHHPQKIKVNKLMTCLLVSLLNTTKSYFYLFSLSLKKSLLSWNSSLKWSCKWEMIWYLAVKVNEMTCAEMIDVLAEVVMDHMRGIGKKSNYLAFSADASEANKTSEEQKLVFGKVVTWGDRGFVSWHIFWSTNPWKSLEVLMVRAYTKQCWMPLSYALCWAFATNVNLSHCWWSCDKICSKVHGIQFQAHVSKGCMFS